MREIFDHHEDFSDNSLPVRSSPVKDVCWNYQCDTCTSQWCRVAQGPGIDPLPALSTKTAKEPSSLTGRRGTDAYKRRYMPALAWACFGVHPVKSSPLLPQCLNVCRIVIGGPLTSLPLLPLCSSRENSRLQRRAFNQLVRDCGVIRKRYDAVQGRYQLWERSLRRIVF